MEIKLFACTYPDFGCGSRTEYILAVDEDMARNIIRDKHGVRKNAKGFYVSELPFVYAERIWKKETRLVSSTAYRPGLGHWDDSSYRQLDVPYCSQCKKETSCGGDFCPKCGAYFKK